MKLRKTTLIFLAGLVWLAAGINILRIGILSFFNYAKTHSILSSVLLCAAAIVILIGFSFMFRNIVTKHKKRIHGYPEERKPFWYVFDLKGYLLMVFMMGLGIGLRRSGLLPELFFAFFYTGLGTALSVAGIRFWIGTKHA